MIHSKLPLTLFTFVFLVLCSPFVFAQSSLDVLEDVLQVSLSQGQTQTATFTVTNTGTTGITLACDASQVDLIDNDNDQITLSCSAPGILAPNQTASVTLTFVSDPLIDFESFGGDLIVKDTISGTANDTLTLDLVVDVDVCDFGIVGDDLEVTIDSPDDGDDFEPGDVIDIDVTVRNVGLNDKRVQVEAFLFAEGGRRVADAASNTQNIENDDEDDFSLSLTIPVDSNQIDPDDAFDLIIKAFDDENEQLDCMLETIPVDIELENKKIALDKRNTLFSQPLAACGDSVFANVKVANVGQNDNDHVRITLENRELKISQQSESFALESFTSEEQNEESKQLQFVLPTNIAEKEYLFDVRVAYDGGSTSTTIPLTVICESKFLVEDIPSAAIIQPLEKTVMALPGKFVSLPLEVTNNLHKKTLFTLEARNILDFAEPASTSVMLNPGQTSTVFLGLRIKDDVEQGLYSIVVEARTAEETVASETVTLEVGEVIPVQTSLFQGVPLWVWIVLNVLLLALIVVGIRLLTRSKIKRFI